MEWQLKRLFKAIDDCKINANIKPLNTKKESEIEIGNKGSFGEDVSTKNYSSLVKKSSNYVKKINTFKGVEIQPEKLYNHKARFNNKNDLEIYSKLIPGKTLLHPDNKAALELVKYSTDSFGDKYFKLDPDKPSRTIVAHLKNDNNGYVH